MTLRIYNPEIFQGNMKKKHYFEGWYYKHVTHDLKQVWSFIPGISLNDTDPHAFIQVINGITGKSEYISYPKEDFTWDKNKLYIKIGDSVFTDKYIDINIENEDLKANGHLSYSNIVRYPKSILSPGIMGWYSYIPTMECKHGIVSVNHDINGSIKINNSIIDFDRGKGYIEKDWGTSFPEAWIWIQANNFKERDSSFSFSVAKIPWRGKFFIGFIAFLFYNRKFFLFSTYNNSIINEMNHTADSISLKMKNKDVFLKVVTRKSTFGDLRAPVSGHMSRRIKESIDSDVSLSLFDKNNTLLYSDTSKRAGLEIIEKIFDYIRH
jgi:tocopherol cyclase